MFYLRFLVILTMTPNQEKTLDDLWSQAVRLNAKSVCQWSGTPGDQCGAQACHIVGRRYLSTRWGTIINGKYDLCGFYASHKIHRLYDTWVDVKGVGRATLIDKLIGRKRYEAIIKKAQETADNQEYEKIAKVLKGYGDK